MSIFGNADIGPLNPPEVLPVRTWLERLRGAPLAERLAEQYRPSAIQAAIPGVRIAALEALSGAGGKG